MPAPGYNYVTLAQALTSLAARLQDPGNVYWSGTELQQYLTEALRNWNALTAFYKTRITFNTVANQFNYDLSTVSPRLVFGYNVTDVQIASTIAYHLLEPQIAGNTWTGTGQFTFQQIIDAIQNRLQQFIGETGCVVSTFQQQFQPGPEVDRMFLPDNVIDIRRAAWVNSYGFRNTLWRQDEWAMNAFLPNRQLNPGLPVAYSVFNLPPIGVSFAPPPVDTGIFDSLAVLSGVQIGLVAAAPIYLNIPDDLTPAIKWGAMADILASDGPCRDQVRSAYCEQRYMEYVEAGKLLPSATLAMVNNMQIDVGSVFDLDCFFPNWQSVPGQPYYIGMAGRNMACLGPVPDAVYGVTLDLIGNAQVPANTQSPLQIARDRLDPILNEAQHLACFKMGGTEFTSTAGLHKSFIESAVGQNGKLLAAARFREALYSPSRELDSEIPVEVPARGMR